VTDNTTTRPFLEYLESRPRFQDKPRGFFPGMGEAPKPPRKSNFYLDAEVRKLRDRS
jgi:hypothetical protein